MEKDALGFKNLPKAVQKGFKAIAAKEKPFFTAPFNWVAEKAVGPKKVEDAYWKVLSPFIKGDVFLGDVAKKITPKKMRGIWDQKIVFPYAKGQKTGIEYAVPTFTAPVKKVSTPVISFLGALKGEELLKGREDNMSTKPIVKEADLKKAAEMLTHLQEQNRDLEKKARATELLYKQAEMGQTKFPRSYAEFQEKVAELAGKDLDVVEEAIKMAASAEADVLGGLDEGSSSKQDPRLAFARTVMEN